MQAPIVPAMEVTEAEHLQDVVRARWVLFVLATFTSVAQLSLFSSHLLHAGQCRFQLLLLLVVMMCCCCCCC